MLVLITLSEARDGLADQPFDLEMSAPGHAVAANLSFGAVLQEVSRFLDLNVR